MNTIRQKILDRLDKAPASTDQLIADLPGEKVAHLRQEIQLLAVGGDITRVGDGRWHRVGDHIATTPAPNADQPLVLDPVGYSLRAAVEATHRALEDYLGHSDDPTLIALLAAVDAAEAAHDRYQETQK